MIQAVFIDYTGTTVHQSGKEMDEIVSIVQEHSSMKNNSEVLEFFYKTRVEKEEASYLKTYRSEDEIIDEQLTILKESYQLDADPVQIKKLIHQFWRNTPVFDDAKEFFQACPLPIYVLTNNGKEFVRETLSYHGMSCQGIISSDDVKAYKPKREIFDAALKACGCKAQEVIHIGDSYSNDVEGALNAGIQPVFISRTHKKQLDGIVCIHNLLEVLDIIKAPRSIESEV